MLDLSLHERMGKMYHDSILYGLQSKPVWQGDATPARTAKRRAANKVAAKTRSKNRRK